MFENLNNLSFGVQEDSSADQAQVIEQVSVSIQKPTVKDYLRKFESAISLDIAKNHTGVIVWDRATDTYETYSIVIDMEYDYTNPYNEINMRLEFKDYIRQLVEGKTFEVAVVENVFGGDNYDTVRKLLALNTVLDELAVTGVCTIKNMYKRDNQTWKMFLRKIHNVKGLKDKQMIERVLLYMEFPMAVQYHNAKPSVKAEMCYEDILDATGMLCALSVELTENPESTGIRKKKLTMKDIEVDHISDMVDLDFLDDDLIRAFPVQEVSFFGRSVEKAIVQIVDDATDKEVVFAMEVPTSKLGTFGIKHEIPYYKDGYCVILFYLKELKKIYKKRGKVDEMSD